jgi:4-diphosphocytidyl-2-C-methyl-D-erythritol kinase
VVVFPNCKINLGLHIVRKRSDNFHDLETIFFPLPFHDIVEIIHSDKAGIITTVSGPVPVMNHEDNLCVKAYRLLQKAFPELPGVQLHLHKAIPTGAGLGGGSADAAFTLRLLNKKFNLGLSAPQLINYALRLGSDCPFFILNKPAFAQGRGEILEPIDLDLSLFNFVIVNPHIHINTAVAFRGIKPSRPRKSVRDIVQQPVTSWASELVNDFENTVFPQYEEIRKIKEKLYELGAVYASMTGTGSTVYGVFNQTLPAITSFPANYLVRISGQQF